MSTALLPDDYMMVRGPEVEALPHVPLSTEYGEPGLDSLSQHELVTDVVGPLVLQRTTGTSVEAAAAADEMIEPELRVQEEGPDRTVVGGGLIQIARKTNSHISSVDSTTPSPDEDLALLHMRGRRRSRRRRRMACGHPMSQGTVLTANGLGCSACPSDQESGEGMAVQSDVS